MNEKKLLFFIAEKDGRVRQIVNKVVTSLNKKTPLAHSPEGHDQIVVIWERNMDRHGMTSNFTLPFGFVLDGLQMLQNDKYRFNIDRELDLIIKRFVCEYEDGKYKEYYKQFFKNEFDFSSAVDNRTDRKFEIALMQGGNAKLLKAFEGTQSDYDFDETHINILFDGIDLYKTAKYEILDGLEISQINYGTVWSIPLSLLTVEGESFGMAFASQELQEILVGSTPFEEWIKTDNWFEKNGETTPNTIITNIKGKIKYKCTKFVATSAAFKVNFYRSNQTTANQADYLLFTQPIVLGGEYEFDVDIDIPLAPGESCIFTGQYLLTGTDVAIEFIEVSDDDKMRVTFKNKFKETVVKAYRLYDLYVRICKQAGISPSDVVSDLLKACSFCITCGDALRGLEGSKIKTMYNDFYKAVDVYCMAGASVEQRKVLIEDRKRFYDYSDPIPLGEVVLNKISDRTDLMFTSIKIGHAEQDIDGINGKYDFNGYQIYSTPIKRIGDKQLDLQSSYSASPYEEEKLRTNYDGKLTTDANGDNKVYAVDVDLTSFQDKVTAIVSFVNTGTESFMITPLGINWNVGQKVRITGSTLNDNEYVVAGVASTFVGNVVTFTIPLQNEALVSVMFEWLSGQVYSLNRTVVPDSGVPSPETIFNVRLHPYLLLQNHLGWIHGVLDKYDSGKLKFESNNMNNDLVVGGVAFNRDITVVEMPAKMMLPTQFDLTSIVPIALPDLMNANPNRCLSFIINGVLYTGFTMTSAMAADIRPQDFTLLSTPINDLTKLIQL